MWGKSRCTLFFLMFLMAACGSSTLVYGQVFYSTSNSVSELAANGTVTTYATGFDGAEGIAFNGSGDLFVANQNNNTISEVFPNGTISTFANTLLNEPMGLTFDSEGNLYVSNFGYQGADAETIVKFTPQGVRSVYATITFPANLSGLAFDSAGNLYFCDSPSGEIYKIVPNGTISLFTHTFSSSEQVYVIPYSLAIDATNNIFVGAYSYLGSVIENYPSNWNPALLADATTEIATGFQGIVGVVFDSSGNLYASSGNGIVEFSADGTTEKTLAANVGSPNYIAFESVPEPSLCFLLVFAFAVIVFARRRLPLFTKLEIRE